MTGRNTRIGVFPCQRLAEAVAPAEAVARKAVVKLFRRTICIVMEFKNDYPTL